jgi:uncharacterized protein (TIGR02246 family)
MKNRHRLVLALGLAFLAAGSFVASGKSPADSAETQEKGHAANGRGAAFIEAFNKGDATAVAAFWAPDATYVDQVGREHKGRAEIERLFQRVFASRKGAKLTRHITSSKQVSPDVILEDGIIEVTPAEGSPVSAARFTAVLVKQDGEWYFQGVHDTLAYPPSNADHLEDLEWLIGEWTGEAEKGQSARMLCNWAENQNFIVSTFATTVDGVPFAGGTQWIAWDAVDKQVRSWSFYSRGGFGEAAWTKDGDRWALKTTARLADGKKVSATNIVTRTDDDHMTWQMTKLTVDGEPQPDPEPVKMRREKQAQPHRAGGAHGAYYGGHGGVAHGAGGHGYIR